MAFTEPFTGTSGTLLEALTGWSINGSEGLYQIGIHSSEVNARTFNAGAGSGSTAYLHTDQGSAYHHSYIQTILFPLSTIYLTVNQVDVSNSIVVRQTGTGAAGRRLEKLVAGSFTALDTSQSVSGEWLAAQRDDANNVSYYEGGTGGSPSWTLIAQVANTDHNTETSQGLMGVALGAGQSADNYGADAGDILGAAPTGNSWYYYAQQN